MKALWNNFVVAESEKTVTFEDKLYFPYDSVKLQYFSKNGKVFSSTTQGVCEYYDIEVGGVNKRDGAWMCPNPKTQIKNIADYFSFDKEIEIKK
ncbi:MAG: DUF427 domain-containing protein [Patescibacteria group bacterium]